MNKKIKTTTNFLLDEFNKQYPDYVYSHEDFMQGYDPIGDFISHYETENDFETRLYDKTERELYWKEIDTKIYKPQRDFFMRCLADSHLITFLDPDYFTLYKFDWNYHCSFVVSKCAIRELGANYDRSCSFVNNYAYNWFFDINEYILNSGIIEDIRDAAEEREMEDNINENYYPFIEDSPEYIEENIYLDYESQRHMERCSLKVKYYDEFGIEIKGRYSCRDIFKWYTDPTSYSPLDEDYYKIYAIDWDCYYTFHVSKYLLDRSIKIRDYSSLDNEIETCLYYINENILDNGLLKGLNFNRTQSWEDEMEIDDYFNENYHPSIEDSPEYIEEEKRIWLEGL